MPKDNCKGLGTTTPVTKKWLLRPKDGYNGDVRSIDICRVKASERVIRFCIGCTHKEWKMGQYVWTRSLKWANEPQNWNLREKHNGKVLCPEKIDDRMAGYPKATEGDQWPMVTWHDDCALGLTWHDWRMTRGVTCDGEALWDMCRACGWVGTLNGISSDYE